MQWSEKQQAVFDWIENGTGNAIIEAVAGAGKTTTLVEAIKHFPAGTTIALCAYNKKMGDELKAKTTGLGGVTAGTLHSFGFAALRRARGRVTVDDKKTQAAVWKAIDAAATHMDAAAQRVARLRPCQQFIIKLVGLAKETGIGFFSAVDDATAWQAVIDHYDLSIENQFEDRYPDIIDFSRRVLEDANANTHTIDFADMIYHVLVGGVPVDQYDVVMVDEAQDTNPTRRALAAKMLKPGGRLIAVGDPYQAIFGFTGADNDSLDQIRRAFNAITLPLNASFRCPQAVVAHARKWVSHIEPVETAAAGEVRTIKYAELVEASEKALDGRDAILCRKTAPLLELAFSLIRRGVGCRVEGRDIGTQLVNLIRKYKVKSLADLSRRIDDYAAREIQKALAKGGDAKAAQIEDRVETLRVLIVRAAELKYDVDGLVTMIQGMFSDTDPGQRSLRPLLTLSTIHKAKGREWDRVFLLGREQFQPSKYARQQWQLDQERNLIYVAVTRAKETLVEVTDVP
jgi:DNA helicase-2/ATP-dependent DNA helicase PcrA